MKKHYSIVTVFLYFVYLSYNAQQQVIWKIGTADNSPAGLDLGVHQAGQPDKPDGQDGRLLIYPR
ncbi:hypothetical protein [Pontibacter sp. SGAir0037]|uniref:hypothetical protein n=1 Tax=Pontibacter sp. SGAir0037 TaxID=2571030 RepID=UPI0010CD45C1|nr:hypothetical protein [Pontibacter sp. SGAir0037]QCR24651.1 hypothetical protein C1N53_21370 [Pontibacter sp. SGAir0037]